MEDSREQQLEDQSVAAFASKTHDVEACLNDLKTKGPSSANIFPWLRLACPVRVAERKRGVCVSLEEYVCHGIEGLSHTLDLVLVGEWVL